MINSFKFPGGIFLKCNQEFIVFDFEDGLVGIELISGDWYNYITLNEFQKTFVKL